MNQSEQILREDLAAAYRMVEMLGLHDMIFTHLSARVPGPQESFLLNPYGLWFSEVTASNLVKLDAEGRIIGGGRYRANPFGFRIHSAYHRLSHDHVCVMHLHSRAGMAISALEEGLLPLNQMSLLFHGRIGQFSYDGNEFSADEQERLVAAMDGNIALLLQNHGIVTVGRTVAEAFYRLYYLEQACRIQLDVLSCGRPYILPDANVSDRMSASYKTNAHELADELWRAVRRRVDTSAPGYQL